MEVAKVGEKALIAVKEAGVVELKGKAKAPAKKVLDEETYSEVRPSFF